MNADSILCPHCEMKLTSKIIKDLVSPELFKKYLAFLKNLEIQNNPNLIWCPNPKCSVVISLKEKKKTF